MLFGKEAAALKEVAVGTHVHVTFEGRDGKRLAVLVRVNGSRPRDVAAKPANDPNALTGKLRHVAYTEREIVLAMPGDKETYVSLPVAADAKITRDDKAIKFDDLKEEEAAVVRTEMRDGKKVATAIMVGKVTMAKPDEPSKIARIRQILKIADVILELAEKNEKK